jgi:excisionase family DNA binding protein
MATKKHPVAPTPPIWRNREEIAKHIGKSTRTVDYMIADGRIQAYRMPGGRSLLIDQNQVDAAIMAAGAVAPEAS